VVVNAKQTENEKDERKNSFREKGEVCPKQCLTGPTRLEMSGNRVYRALARARVHVRPVLLSITIDDLGGWGKEIGP
jgi:hypothetical protein